MIEELLYWFPRYTLLAKGGLDEDLFGLFENCVDWDVILTVRERLTRVLIIAQEPRGIDFD